MKKIATAIAALLVSALAMTAQDLKEVTEMYNTAATALNNGEKVEAFTAFQMVLSSATSLGEEGKEIADQCKGVLPQLGISIAKDFVKAGDVDSAIAKLKEILPMATEFENAEAVEEANTLIGQFLAKKGNDALNAKDYTTAIAAYKDVLAADAANGAVALRLGMALAATGDNASAIEAFKQAAANGQEAAANKQMANISLKEAAAALKAKQFKTAFEKAVESAQINPSANAYKIAGNAAGQLKNYKAAIENFSEYLKLAPTAPDAAQIKAAIEAYKKL